MSDPILQSFLEKLGPLAAKIRTIYLFGSRAKGTQRPDSDYDVLIVVKKSFTPADKDRLYDYVMEILFDTSKLLSLKIFKEPEFERLRHLKTPFMRHILEEGIEIG